MKSGILFRLSRCLFCASLLFSIGLARGEDKHIHLRNELIVTPPAQTTPASSQIGPTNGSRLFLIQFENHPLAAQRADLQSMGVDLLKYVPDDAFIARLTNASPTQVRALSFVRWVGPYLVKHKIHPRLTAAMQRTNAALAVNLLLSPRATVNEVNEVHGILQIGHSRKPFAAG